MKPNWLSEQVIGISVASSPDLLSLGFGREHLRECLFRISQSLLRAGANLAYGGHFKKDSFTRELIHLISEEQREGIGDSETSISKLYNHSAWPYYEDISDEDEAYYIEACRFVKIGHQLASLQLKSQK